MISVSHSIFLQKFRYMNRNMLAYSCTFNIQVSHPGHLVRPFQTASVMPASAHKRGSAKTNY